MSTLAAIIKGVAVGLIVALLFCLVTNKAPAPAQPYSAIGPDPVAMQAEEQIVRWLIRPPEQP